jgi:hypothetical protein
MSHFLNAKVLGILGALALVVMGMSCGSSAGVDKSVSSTYTISGFVFLDANHDGIYNTADTPQAGAVVRFWSTAVPPVVMYEATTNSFGHYTMSVAQGSFGVLKQPVEDPGDDYIPPFCNISGDPSTDRIISFYK